MAVAITNITRSLRKHPDFKGHESVFEAHDEASGYRGLIAVHDTRLGPSLGGTRYWTRYDSRDEAVKDVLRLSEGMTYKNAIANIPFGGGKSVVYGPDVTRDDKAREAVFIAHARAVEALGGRYIMAEDVGTSVADMQVAARASRFVAGLPLEGEGCDVPAPDPSIYTALGTFEGIRESVTFRFGSDDLDGVKVAVKGLGHVASILCGHLEAAGADLLVCDIDEARVRDVLERTNAKAVDPADILTQRADVYAPCALGGDLTPGSVAAMHFAAVAGCANNQLDRRETAALLKVKGILYAPDFVINAGGVASVGRQAQWSLASDPKGPMPTHTELSDVVRGTISGTLREVFERSRAEGRTTAELAHRIANERLAKAVPGGPVPAVG